MHPNRDSLWPGYAKPMDRIEDRLVTLVEDADRLRLDRNKLRDDLLGLRDRLDALISEFD